jgi:hypothetical protein
MFVFRNSELLIIHVILLNIGNLFAILLAVFGNSYFLLLTLILFYLVNYTLKKNVIAFRVDSKCIKLTRFLSLLIFNEELKFSQVVKFTYESNNGVRGMPACTFYYFNKKGVKRKVNLIYSNMFGKERLIELLNFLKDKVEIDNKSFEKLDIILDKDNYRVKTYNYNKY